jgi:hypothetical protein
MLTLLTVGMLISAEPEETDPRALAMKVEQSFHADSNDNFRVFLSEAQDSKGKSTSLALIAAGQANYNDEINKRGAKTECVEIISDFAIGTTIRIVKVHRLFDQGFGLMEVAMIRRGNAWKVKEIEISVDGNLSNFINRIYDRNINMTP